MHDSGTLGGLVFIPIRSRSLLSTPWLVLGLVSISELDRVDVFLPLGIRGAGLWLKGIRGHATYHPRACESKHSSPSDDILPRTKELREFESGQHRHLRNISDPSRPEWNRILALEVGGLAVTRIALECSILGNTEAGPLHVLDETRP
jgi:hypothetical protein